MPGWIIYDFDGTLAQTLEAGIDIYNAIAERRGYRPILPPDAPALRGLGVSQLLRRLGIPITDLPVLVRSLRGGLRERMVGIPPVPGMPEMIRKMKAGGFRQAIMTSNSEENIRAFLDRHDLDVFDRVYSGSSLFGKGRLLRRFLRSEGVSPGDAVYVGDELRDLEAARAAGVRFAAVAWGANSREALVAAGAAEPAADPRELAEILFRATMGESSERP